MRGIVLTREMARNTSGRKAEKFSQDDTEVGSHGRNLWSRGSAPETPVQMVGRR